MTETCSFDIKRFPDHLKLSNNYSCFSSSDSSTYNDCAVMLHSTDYATWFIGSSEGIESQDIESEDIEVSSEILVARARTLIPRVLLALEKWMVCMKIVISSVISRCLYTIIYVCRYGCAFQSSSQDVDYRCQRYQTSLWRQNFLSAFNKNKKTNHKRPACHCQVQHWRMWMRSLPISHSIEIY